MSGGGGGLDLPGAALWSGALVLLMLGLSRGPELGWAAPPVWALLGGAMLLFVAFSMVERAMVGPLGHTSGRDAGHGARRGGLAERLGLASGLQATMRNLGVAGGAAAMRA